MKILVVSRGNIPGRAANAIQLHRMADAFVKLGHEVSLVTRIGAKPNDIRHQFGGKIKQYLTVILYTENRFNKIYRIINKLILAYLMRTLRYDLIFTRDLDAIEFAPLTKRIIWETHSLDISRKEIQLSKKINILKTITITEQLRASLLRQGVVSEVLHDAYEEIFPTEIGNLKRQVTFTGHLYKDRGIDQLIRCAARLPHVPFKIYGGTEKDISYWSQQKLTSNISFEGFVYPSEISQIQSSSTILVINYSSNLNTATYCSPLKLHEYIATKNIVICTNFGPIVEEYEKFLTIVPPDDDDNLTKAIKLAWDNQEYIIKKLRKTDQGKDRGFTWTQRAKLVLSYVS